MTRDAALAWVRSHETTSNEQAAQSLLALLDEERSDILARARRLYEALDRIETTVVCQQELGNPASHADAIRRIGIMAMEGLDYASRPLV